MPEVDLLLGRVSDQPAFEVALSVVLLEAVAGRERRGMLRCYRPLPTVAFGRRDALLAGFPAAVDAARRHGFAPVIRAPGGRAAAYDAGSLVIEEIMADADSMAGMHARFEREAALQAAALRDLGLDARVGEVPGEYCPGAFSVNARGARKLIGAAQRVIRGGWLLSSVVVVEGATGIRGVLEQVYHALELEWQPDTVGAIAEEAPGIGVDDVQRAMLGAYAERYELLAAGLPPDVQAEASSRVARHIPA